MKEHPYGPGRLRFRSNGMPNDGKLEVLQEDGTWLWVRGLTKVASFRLGVGEFPELKAEFTMVEVDVEVLETNATFIQLPPNRLSQGEEEALAEYRKKVRAELYPDDQTG